MRKALAVGIKEFRQIRRDRRTLMILLFIPVFFLLLYGYALNFDIKHVRLAVEDRDYSPESRRLVSAFVNSTYFDQVAAVTADAEVNDLMDRDRIRAALIIPQGLGRDLVRGVPTSVEVLINGENSTTAATVLGYAQTIIASESARYEMRARTRMPGGMTVVQLEPRVWYNPDLKSTLFLVPGLLAYIAMITAVVSTALAVVREKERGTVEQVRMAPIGTLPFIVGKSLPYFVISFVAAIGVIVASMVLFDLPPALARVVPVWRARDGPAHLGDCREPAGRLPDGAAVVVPADDHALGLHLSDLEYAGCTSGDHVRRTGALFSRRATRGAPERRRVCRDRSAARRAGHLHHPGHAAGCQETEAGVGLTCAGSGT
jgi:ABC-type Na+ efflux pump permease subunit